MTHEPRPWNQESRCIVQPAVGYPIEQRQAECFCVPNHESKTTLNKLHIWNSNEQQGHGHMNSTRQNQPHDRPLRLHLFHLPIPPLRLLHHYLCHYPPLLLEHCPWQSLHPTTQAFCSWTPCCTCGHHCLIACQNMKEFIPASALLDYVQRSEEKMLEFAAPNRKLWSSVLVRFASSPIRGVMWHVYHHCICSPKNNLWVWDACVISIACAGIKYGWVNANDENLEMAIYASFYRWISMILISTPCTWFNLQRATWNVACVFMVYAHSQ